MFWRTGTPWRTAGFTYTINWGDGSPVQTVARTANNGNGVSRSHVYVTAGTYSYTYTASTVGIVTESTGEWLLNDFNRSGAPTVTPFQFGTPGHKFLAGDWDGDGIWTPGVSTNPTHVSRRGACPDSANRSTSAGGSSKSCSTSGAGRFSQAAIPAQGVVALADGEAGSAYHSTSRGSRSAWKLRGHCRW